MEVLSKSYHYPEQSLQTLKKMKDLKKMHEQWALKKGTFVTKAFLLM